MKKLTSLLRWIDDNLIKIFLAVFIFLIPLYPKFPLIDLEYTYISVRFEDLFVALFYVIFVLQVLRKKIILRKKFLLLFVFFWIATLASFFVGFYLQKTIPVYQIGFLHALRRIEYMFVFFIAVSAIASKKDLPFYLNLYFIALLLVGLYGIGQRFTDLPAVQTMNPEYARGRILTLTPEARISSTFGGHFDLSAYLVFSIPLVLGYYFFSEKKKYAILFALSITTLLYTAQRISFIAYVISVTTFLMFFRKFRFFVFTAILTAALMFVTGDLSKRFAQTFQFKQVFVNLQTGDVVIDQTITTRELPAGGFEIPLLSKKGKKTARQVVLDEKTKKEILEIAREQARKEALREGRTPTNKEAEKRAQQIAGLINVKNTVLCDISCSTRLQVEWPRAIASFIQNPLFGTGPSSITEATDNDYLRWLGELGLLGTVLFVYILYSLVYTIIQTAKKASQDQKYLFLGFLFGLFALFINATYIDVFEASKVAYSFWLMAGLVVGQAALVRNSNV